MRQARTVSLRGRRGIKIAPHPHIWGPIERPEEVRGLLDQTDPALVWWIPDTAQLNLGGGDPVRACLERLGLRVVTVDVSTFGKPSPATVSPLEVARHHPRGRSAVFTGDRGSAGWKWMSSTAAGSAASREA